MAMTGELDNDGDDNGDHRSFKYLSFLTTLFYSFIFMVVTPLHISGCMSNSFIHSTALHTHTFSFSPSVQHRSFTRTAKFRFQSCSASLTLQSLTRQVRLLSLRSLLTNFNKAATSWPVCETREINLINGSSRDRHFSARLHRQSYLSTDKTEHFSARSSACLLASLETWTPGEKCLASPIPFLHPADGESATLSLTRYLRVEKFGMQEI